MPGLAEVVLWSLVSGEVSDAGCCWGLYLNLREAFLDEDIERFAARFFGVTGLLVKRK